MFYQGLCVRIGETGEVALSPERKKGRLIETLNPFSCSFRSPQAVFVVLQHRLSVLGTQYNLGMQVLWGLGS